MQESFGSLRMFQTFNCSSDDVNYCLNNHKSGETRVREVSVEDCTDDKIEDLTEYWEPRLGLD